VQRAHGLRDHAAGRFGAKGGLAAVTVGVDGGRERADRVGAEGLKLRRTQRASRLAGVGRCVGVNEGPSQGHA